MPASSKEIFSAQIKAGRRVYFIDVKEAHGGVRYLVISETQSSGSKWRHNRVMVFQEHIPAFMETLNEALGIMGYLLPSRKTYSVEKIRQEYPKAYTKWTREEEVTLREGFLRGVSVKELSAILGRQPGAIRSRLQKLGLLKGVKPNPP